MTGPHYAGAVELDLPGGRVAAVRRGAGGGRPALLLHGIPLSLTTWRHNLDPLAAGREVVAVDLRGYGESDKPAGADYSPAGQAAMLADLLDATGLSEVDIVGSSYGCAVALTLAATRPSRVGRLVLVNPVCYPGGPHDLERLSRIRLVAAVARTVLRTTGPGRRLLTRRLQASYADPGLATPELVDGYHRQLLRQSGEQSYLTSLRSLRQEDLVALLPRVPHRTLVLWGELDHVLPAADGPRLVADLPDARLELVAGVGHLPHEEAPDRVNALIDAFLSEPAPPRPGPTAPASKGSR